ncbi:MAG: glycoside hydrolase family 10 protein [Prevotella sp.]
MSQKTRIFALLLLIILPYIAIASPKREVRAVWLTTIGGLDWPHSYAYGGNGVERQKEELCSLLNQYQKAGINTVLLQTRIRGTVIYPSVYEPWDGCLSGHPGTSPGYDALAYAIEQCHKRGMELHAWVVTIPVGKWNATGCARLRKKYPKLIKKIGPDGYMDPENKLTAEYIANICEEITRNYDIDGIHLDYIRYPETWKYKVTRSQGRKHITDIVRQISTRVKVWKPWVKMSCSPVGKHDDLPRFNSHGWNAFTTVCQDAQGWLREGLMDALFPMMYFRGNQFFPFAIDWAEQSYGRMVAPGLGIYFLSPKEGNWKVEDITREMHVLRQYGMGHTFFRGKFLTDNCQGIYDFTARDFNQHPALVPAMTWIDDVAPDSPAEMRFDAGRLWWTSVKEAGVTYNVYASEHYPVNIDDAANLVAVRLDRTNIVADNSHRHYAITAMDRYGNESKPLQEPAPTDSKPCDTLKRLLPCDGYRLLLPKSDADMVVFETLQGTIVRTTTHADTMDVSRLPKGMYIVRSLNSRGITHRLGHFRIKRNI